MLIYSWSSNMSKISFKKSFGEVYFFFQILAEIEMWWTENQLFGRHFETVQIFILFYFILFYLTLFYFILFYYFI